MSYPYNSTPGASETPMPEFDPFASTDGDSPGGRSWHPGSGGWIPDSDNSRNDPADGDIHAGGGRHFQPGDDLLGSATGGWPEGKDYDPGIVAHYPGWPGPEKDIDPGMTVRPAPGREVRDRFPGYLIGNGREGISGLLEGPDTTPDDYLPPRDFPIANVPDPSAPVIRPAVRIVDWTKPPGQVFPPESDKRSGVQSLGAQTRINGEAGGTGFADANATSQSPRFSGTISLTVPDSTVTATGNPPGNQAASRSGTGFPWVNGVGSVPALPDFTKPMPPDLNVTEKNSGPLKVGGISIDNPGERPGIGPNVNRKMGVAGSVLTSDLQGNQPNLREILSTSFQPIEKSATTNVFTAANSVTPMGDTKVKTPSNPRGERPRASDLWGNYTNFDVESDPHNIYIGVGGELAELNRLHGQNEHDDYYDSCALRLSVALNHSGADVPSKVEGLKLDSLTTQDERLPDLNGPVVPVSYITGAADMDKYLTKKWGDPEYDLNINELSPEEVLERLKEIQKTLKPGEIAVMANSGHVGLITPSYMDHTTQEPQASSPHVWILDDK